MRNKLRILKSTTVYDASSVKSVKIDTLEPDVIVDFTREKRRNGINWIEIFIHGSKKAYIKKDREHYKIQDLVKLTEEQSRGFAMQHKSTSALSPKILIKKAKINADNTISKPLTGFELVQLGGKASAYFEYSTRQVELIPMNFTRGDLFHIVEKSKDKSDPFLLVDNYKGKRGYLLKSSSFTSIEDAPFILIGKIIMAVVVILIIVSILSTGWLVVSGLMLIPAMIIALIIAFSLQGTYNMIRKRI